MIKYLEDSVSLEGKLLNPLSNCHRIPISIQLSGKKKWIISLQLIIIIIFYFNFSPRTSQERLGENEFVQKEKKKKNKISIDHNVDVYGILFEK